MWELASSSRWDICDLHSSDRSHPPPSSHLLYSAFRLCYENLTSRGSSQKQTPPPPSLHWSQATREEFLHNLSKLRSGETEDWEESPLPVISSICLAGHDGCIMNETSGPNGLKSLITFTSDLSLKLVLKLLAPVKHNKLFYWIIPRLHWELEHATIKINYSMDNYKLHQQAQVADDVRERKHED